ncbi:hypothetical protein pdam_00012162 [Pocillopora damicornis]|uniref:HECT domain-containing protein n=1 Tax=Pocillopora damicornis TaxID=46731 RepID=A0A3M6UDZ3_POCDA|nr:hypothetical protein pdam_00012162 [Pocillopora damicornis]
MDLNRSIIRSEVRQTLEEYMQSNTNRSANAGETGRLEASPQNTSTSTTSQRLNSEIGQVVNRARDILRSNRSSFTRNASTSFQNGATSAYPKRPRLSGASRYGNVLPKDVVKTVVLLENSGSSNEYLLKNDTIMCYAEVDFVTTDDERLVRNKIVGALKTQRPDIAPDDFEFVKVLGKRVSTPVVADGYNWDFKHNGIRCLRQMFPQHDEDYLKEIFSGSLDLPDAIDEVLKSEKEQEVWVLQKEGSLAEVLQSLADKVLKITIDPDDLIADTIAFYKNSTAFDASKGVRVQYKSQPAVDTGGIRREFFNDATKAIATFPAFKLLEGSDHRKLPAYNSTSVHSGLMEVLGRLIGHGILQSFIGFPCFAPPVYWYIATGDVHKALCYVTVDDVRDEEAREFIEKLSGATSPELQELRKDSNFISLCNECGISTLLSDDNRNLILQSLILHYVLNRKKVLLDQLRSGLKSSKVLHAIEKNPTLFETLFVHSATRLDATAIKDLLKPKSPLSSDEHRQIWGYLFQFIDECNETDLKSFMRFLTGCESIPAAGIEGGKITVSFNKDGTVFSSACLHQLELPGRADSYSEFQTTLKSVIDDSFCWKSFNSI